MTIRSALKWILSILWFPFYLVYELVSGSLLVGWDILTPGSSATPAFVEVPLRCRNDGEIAALANLISLTPGSITVAARHSPATLWVHEMYAADHDSAVRAVHLMEDHLLLMTRPEGRPPRPDDLDRDKGGQRR